MRTSTIGADVRTDKGCQWGCSVISCDSGTKSSLGPDSYFTGGLYTVKPNTRIRATSATNAANCRTCQLDKSYVSVHCPIHCIASPLSEVPSGRVHQSQGFQKWEPAFTLPYLYSEHAYRSSESMRNIITGLPNSKGYDAILTIVDHRCS